MRTLLNLLMIAVLSGLAFTHFAQTTTLKWVYTDPAKSGVTQSRTETFDWQYGRIGRSATSPYKLAIEKDGVYLTRTNALAELRLPVWGDGSQKFEETLPNLTAAVPAQIHISVYSWFPYPDTVPSTEALYDYEAKSVDGKIYQRLDLSTIPAWGILNVVEWRPFNPSPYPIFYIDNPLYPIIELQRTHERELYAQILSETFVQMGTYTFPSFKVADGCQWFLKMENETTFSAIPMDPNYWLASSSGGWKQFLLPLKPIHVKDWQTFVPQSILLSGEARVKVLLGL